MQIRQLASGAAALMILLGLAQVVAGLPTVCPFRTLCVARLPPLTHKTCCIGSRDARDSRKSSVFGRFA